MPEVVSFFERALSPVLPVSGPLQLKRYVQFLYCSANMCAGQSLASSIAIPCTDVHKRSLVCIVSLYRSCDTSGFFLTDFRECINQCASLPQFCGPVQIPNDHLRVGLTIAR